MLAPIASSNFRKLVLEAALREFPDIYCSVMRKIVADRLNQLDEPLNTPHYILTGQLR